MRQADGKLFRIDIEAGEVTSNPNVETRAVPYEQAPGSDPRRLAEGMLRAAASQMGVQLNLAAPALAHKLQEAFEAAHEGPPSLLVEELPRLFSQEGQQRLRWALVQAASEHRRHQARRTVLFLRGLARTVIASLIDRNRLDALTPAEFKEHIWTGGHVTLGNRKTRDTAEGGPIGSHLLSAGRRPIESNCTGWQTGWRGFDSQSGDPVTDGVGFAGNLTWPDKGRTPPPEGQGPAIEDLKQLLYGQSDAFVVFQELTRDENRRTLGLDERIASLLLHAVYPDHYVPYYPELARRVLGVLRLEKNPRYDLGFEGYCNLANDLLADNDFGFENLADVGYFLQRLAENKVNLEGLYDSPTDLRVKLQTVNLKHKEVDTCLVIRQGVLEQATAALNAGQHVILIGPPGTGKTTLAEDLCRHAHDLNCSRGHVLVTSTADWTTFDTIGGYMPESDGRLVFRPGIFLEAIEGDKWLVIDEINRADIDKAFGELFTVLSSQAVTLPYRDNGRQVRILPPGHPASKETRDYAIHPSWRIIGTMNIYDKASLFAMSYAFMRRFAFVDVTIPPARAYRHLIKYFLRLANLPADESEILNDLYSLFDRDNRDNQLMRWRALGPAIAQDVVRYLRHRTDGGQSPITRGHLAEALLLYVVPQFDGLERSHILQIHGQLKGLFKECPLEQSALLERVEELFPFIPPDEWEKTC
jgi:MoxR-like ATPase